MKIEVKNIKVNMSFSEETICFKGDLYMDGKKVGYCENDGRGGCTYYSGTTLIRSEDIKKMEEYCKTLPKVKYGDKEWENSLENVIDEIIDNYVNEKEEKKFKKKMEKDMLNKLVLTKGDPRSYQTVNWKGWEKFTIQQIVSNPNGREVLKKTIQDLKNEGFTVLNTNIPQELM